MDGLYLHNTMFNPHLAVINNIGFTKIFSANHFLAPEESPLFSFAILLRTTLVHILKSMTSQQVGGTWEPMILHILKH